MRGIRFAPEPDDVYVVLVRELATAYVPVAVSGALYASVSGYIAYASGSIPLLILALLCAALSVTKFSLMIHFHRQPDLVALDIGAVRRWEKMYGAAAISLGCVLGLVIGETFLEGSQPLQMLATGLLFGYCSGVVARTAIRPALAIAQILPASCSAMLGAFLQGTPTHLVLAGIFGLFLIGSMESIHHVAVAATRQIAQRLDMATLARNDPLSGLANRLGLREAFRELAGGSKVAPMVAIHCLDLDGFKPINDRYGHPMGDDILRLVAERLRRLTKDAGTAARIGGDEFVVLQAPIQRASEADLFARRLVREITAPYEIDGQIMPLGVSLGYTTSPPDARDLDQLFEIADAALYKVKVRGGGGVGAANAAA